MAIRLRITNIKPLTLHENDVIQYMISLWGKGISFISKKALKDDDGHTLTPGSDATLYQIKTTDHENS